MMGRRIHRNRWQTNFAKMKRIVGLMVAVRLMGGQPHGK